MNKTFTEQTHKQLIKKLHVLLAKARVGAEDKRSILAAYGVDHSNELSCYHLVEICDKLESIISPANAELDKARKCVMASIGGWLELSGCKVMGNRAEYIKGIACRVSKVDRFNAIPIERLRNISHLFAKKQKDATAVDTETAMIVLTNSLNPN